MGQNPSLLEKINVDTDIHRLYGPLMGFEIMTTLNLPKTWPVSDAAFYSEHLQLRHLAKSKKTIHNAMAMLAPAATAPTLRGVPSHTVSLSSFGRGVRGQKAVGG